MLTCFQMLGGGHVRRRSLDSAIDCSPCHGRKTTGLQVQDIGPVLPFEQSDEDEPLPTPLPPPDNMPTVSPEKHILSKPSIASTSSYQFGDERMIRVRRGLLERQSLEDSALMAQGEEFLASRKLF